VKEETAGQSGKDKVEEEPEKNSKNVWEQMTFRRKGSEEEKRGKGGVHLQLSLPAERAKILGKRRELEEHD